MHSQSRENQLVDERDFHILSRLRGDPFSSYETLGRGVGLSGKAVKTRIEALEEIGVLTSLRAMPAAQVFRRFPRLFLFKQPVTARENLKRVVELDPVVFATLDANHNAAVLTYNRLPSARPPEELSRLLGPTELEVTPMFPHPGAKLLRPVSLAELKVLRALIVNLRMSVSQISHSTGLSQKVVKRARKQLLERGLFQVQPIFQSAQSSRILMYELHVHSDEDSVLSRVSNALPRSVFVNQWEHTAMIFSCWAESVAEVYETERRLKGEPGVTGVRVKFHTTTLLSSSRLAGWIDAEILRQERG